MSRVSDAEIDEIIEVDSSVTTYEPFKTAASILVVTKIGTDLEEATLKEIERWLSAHFIAIRDMRSSMEKAGSVSQSFQHKVDLNLSNTMYGQQAMMLDTTGKLLAISKGKTGSSLVTTINPDLWE